MSMGPSALRANQQPEPQQPTGDHTPKQAAFTPGPWVFVEHIEAAIQFGVDDAWEVGSQALETGVALVPGREANARLIAAAPDLFYSLDPDTLDFIADEIETANNRASAAMLRFLATKQRAALAKVQA